MMASSDGETAGLTLLGGAGAWVRCFSYISLAAVGPGADALKGSAPVAISYMITPRE